MKQNSHLDGIRTHGLSDTGAVLYQLSYQANWELAVLDLRDIKYIQYLLYQISMSVLCMRARVRKMLIVLIVTTPTAVHVNKDSPEMVQSAGSVMAQTS